MNGRIQDLGSKGYAVTLHRTIRSTYMGHSESPSRSRLGGGGGGGLCPDVLFATFVGIALHLHAAPWTWEK
jgi:hypothetical protein